MESWWVYLRDLKINKLYQPQAFKKSIIYNKQYIYLLLKQIIQIFHMHKIKKL